MQQQERIWHLLSRYLTGDASSLEIQELQDSFCNNAENKMLLDALSGFWKTSAAMDDEELKKAWDKHKPRIG